MFFAKPILLIGLIAVLIPIIIHLVHFHRYKKVYFSNVEMLEELQNEAQQRSRLRELLILAARILAIALIVIAFAQPKLKNGENMQAEGSTAVSIYIDNSFSMGEANSEGQLMEQARAKARQIVSAYPASTRYQLLTNDNMEFAGRWFTQDEATDGIDGIGLCPMQLSLAEIVAIQKDFLTQTSAKNNHSYIISDFQKNMGVGGEIQHATGGDEAKCSQYVVPIKADGTGNLYIDTLWFESPIVQSGTVFARLRNTGNKAIEDIAVKLYINGEQRSMASVNIDKDGEKEVCLTFTYNKQEIAHGQLVITDYPITFDDTLYFSINASGKLNILELDEQNSNTYISRLFSDDTLMEYRSSLLRLVDPADIKDANLLVLNSIREIPSGIAQMIQDFVAHGGSLLVIPERECNIDSYNMLLSEMNAPQLISFDTTRAECVKLNHKASLFEFVFSKAVTDDVELPSINGYFPLSYSGETVCEEIIGMSNGRAYLVETPYERGKVYLMSSPLHEKYSDFMHQALFVPTIYNMALFSRPLTESYYMIGTANHIAIKSASSTRMELKNRDGNQSYILTSTTDGGGRYLNIGNFRCTAGNYTLTYDEGQAGVSFNYSRSESVMDYMDVKAIEDALSVVGVERCESLDSKRTPIDEQIRSRINGKELWRWCVIGCLVMLMVEILLTRIPQNKRT